nr:unnamed protein product [Callosobruchus chinensis]
MWKILYAGSAGRQLKLRNTSSSIVLPCAEEARIRKLSRRREDRKCGEAVETAKRVIFDCPVLCRRRSSYLEVVQEEGRQVKGPRGQLFVSTTDSLSGNPTFLPQVLASLAVSLGPLAAGLGKGYSSPAIASLTQKARDTPAPSDAFPVVSAQQTSWLASLSLLGALFGAPVGGVAVRFGRKRALVLAGLPLSICWATTAWAASVEVIEIAAPCIRGGLSAMLKVAGHAGVLVAFAAGAFLDWRRLAGMIAFAPAAMCILLLRVPESPGWLLELGVLQAHVLSRPIPANPKVLIQSLKTPVMIACGLMFFQRFSGVNAFNFYVVSVFQETFGGTNPHSAAVAVAVDSAGRLPLLVASSVMMTMALASFGSFSYYKETSPRTGAPHLDWIPLLCVLLFTVAFSLGISPISWLLVSELFSLEHRGFGTALATAFSYLCAFIGVKTFIDFKELLGLYGAFWLYAFISVCGLCFVVCCVPETKGQDLTEIDTGR